MPACFYSRGEVIAALRVRSAIGQRCVAAAATLTIRNLIDEKTGEVRLWVLKGLARRVAMRTWGEITPRSLRAAVRMMADTVPEMQCAWRRRHGLPIAMSTNTPLWHGARWRAPLGLLRSPRSQ